MALDNAALLEALEAMQAAGVEARVRTAGTASYQAMVDAEPSVIAPGPGTHGSAHDPAQQEPASDVDDDGG